jgi:hypothetical protein
MKLEHAEPAPGLVVDLAPRVEGTVSPFVGEYGYALALTAEGKVRVSWDDDTWGDVDPKNIRFFQAGRH